MAHEIVFTDPRRAVLSEVALPDLGPDDVLVESLCSLVSTGTELTAFNQRFGAGSNWETYARLPFKPGYATVGVVTAIGDAVSTIRPGQRVALEAPHASHHVRPASEVQLISASIPPEHAAWFTLAQIAFRGFWNTQTRIGQSLVVVGAGPIGQMVIRWAAAAGLARISVVDPAGQRLAHAVRGGATHTYASPLGSLVESFDNEVEADPPVYIDTTGNAAVLADVLARAPQFGRVVLLGDPANPGDQRLTSDVLRKDLTITGAFGAQARKNMPNRFVREHFIALVGAGRFLMDGLVTHRFDPENCQAAYELLDGDRGGTMGAVFSWGSPT